MVTTLNIRKIFSLVCDDCIGIILDYIDTPHDILKLIYYNKYYLYDLNRNDNYINKTIDCVQLLLYEKFYEKVLTNLNDFCDKSNVKWSEISNLLNESTVLAGGSILQSILGEIKESAQIPLDFYYNEYTDIYPKINYNELELLIEKYNKKNTITVCTDLDIFKTIDLDIFSSNGIVEYFNVYHKDLNSIDIYRMKNNKYNVIIHIGSDYLPYLNKNYSNDIFLRILSNEEYDLYVEYEIIEYQMPFNICRNMPIHDENNECYEHIEDDHECHKYIEYKPSDINCDKDVGEEIDIKYYKIIDQKCLCGLQITRNEVLNIIMNQKEKIQRIYSIPKEIKNLQIACSKSGGHNFAKYLLENNDELIRNVKKMENKFRKTEMRKGSYSHSSLVAYDNLQALYEDNDIKKVGSKWIESKYDLTKINYSSDIFFSDEERKMSSTYYCRMFNTESKKKIIPFTYPINKTLMLNLVYINQNIFVDTNTFIENDFDIDICKQQFNGEKIKLGSISNLIHKRFRYNTKHIDDVDAKNNVYKYICFRKRTEKYKAKGFTFLDEINVINAIKNSLGINNMNKNIKILQEYTKRSKYLKKYYDDVVLNKTQK